MGKGEKATHFTPRERIAVVFPKIKNVPKKISRPPTRRPVKERKHDDEMSWFTALTTYFAFGIIILLGHLRDLFLRLSRRGINAEKEQGFVPLLSDFDDFYTRRLYGRILAAFNRPISSAPGARIDVMERAWNESGDRLVPTGRTINCLNLGSYNYLGFAETNDNFKQQVLSSLRQYSAGTCSSSNDAGMTDLHVELERLIARFVGKEAAMICGMGFATNSTVIPALVGKGDLIVSDELNHSSIVTGARMSGAKVRVFRHNDADDLEKVIREAIAQGQPRTHRPWSKILIVVEGIYSMEGVVCCLDEIVQVKKKYKAYLYLDEAHSIGAMGATGRGVCEHKGVDPADVDILMGTFTKSFGAVGGYIAGSSELVAFLKTIVPGHMYASSMSTPCVQQCLSALKVIAGEDGTELGAQKLRRLRENSIMFRKGLKEMGCKLLGDDDSPVIPVLLYNPARLAAFAHLCLQLNLAVVVVGFPATPLLKARVRFCMSAAHSKQDLYDALDKISDVANRIGICYDRE